MTNESQNSYRHEVLRIYGKETSKSQRDFCLLVLNVLFHTLSVFIPLLKKRIQGNATFYKKINKTFLNLIIGIPLARLKPTLNCEDMYNTGMLRTFPVQQQTQHDIPTSTYICLRNVQ
uniref:Uncharacterized protein n=1 Tax=Glossina pallidipes TaxID=7398 RepID=A0A1B0AAK4_GLOPL